MAIMFESLHCITKIKVSEIESTKRMYDGHISYSRHIIISGFKGHLSKNEGSIEFLDMVLFSDNKESLEFKFK